MDPSDVGQAGIIEPTPAPLDDYEDSEPEIEDVVIEDEDPEPQQEPSQEEIEDWMSPDRARQKALQLYASYRKASRFGQQLKAQRENGEKWRTQNAKLRLKNKCEKKIIDLQRRQKISKKKKCQKNAVFAAR